ncbi:MAG: efflux RND transporter periplasmic adaptor subunit [Polyangiales bacterium]
MKQLSPSTVVSTLLAALVAFGLGRYALPSRAVAPPTVSRAPERAPSARRVRLPEELARRAGVRVERAASRPMLPSLDLVGTVEFDRDKLAEVGARIGGRITRVFVRAGDRVRAGDPIAEVESAELGEATAQYLSATARSIAARAEASRTERLARERLATARDQEQARAERDSIAAELRGARSRLSAMGVRDGDVAAGRGVTLRSPIEGWVIDRPALLGESVDRTDTVARIADLRLLWVELEVFEKDLGRVRVRDRTEITTDSAQGHTFVGLVDHIGPVVDRDSRTAPVRVIVPNPELVLRPGMFVNARLRLDGSSAGGDAGAARVALTIARSSVLQLDGRPAVFVEVAANEYEPRSVELGHTDGDHVEISRGLSDGDRVVVEGAFAVKSELLR